MKQLELGFSSAPLGTTTVIVPSSAAGSPRSLAAPPEPPASARSASPADELRVYLQASLGRPVELAITDNRSTMISYREGRSALRVRLHRMFLEASDTEWRALAAYLRGGDRRATAALDAYIRGRAPRREVNVAALRSRGRFFDLVELWREQNRQFFHEASVARITWGTASARRYRRTIQLGCYVHEERLIRIHPALDQAFVPRHYVGWIIFHEMLHEVFGVEERGGRRCVHPPEFAAVEQSHPDFARCKAWEAANIYRLLRYRG